MAPVLKIFPPSHTYLASSILLDSRHTGILDGCRFIKHTPWFTTFGATIVDHLNTQTFMPNRIGSFVGVESANTWSAVFYGA